MALMTQKAYAAKRKCSPQYINKLVGQQVIRLVRGKVDPRQADAAIAANRTRLGSRGKGAGGAPTKNPAKAHRSTARARKTGRPAADPNQSDDKPQSATRSLASAKAEREHYMAAMAKLEYEKTIGKMLVADEVLKAEQKKNANLRTRLRRLPRQLAPILVRASSPAEIEKVLLQEVDLLLEELAADPLGEAAAVVPAEIVQASAGAVEVNSIQESAAQ